MDIANLRDCQLFFDFVLMINLYVANVILTWFLQIDGKIIGDLEQSGDIE